ncbi:hypothetical protein AAG570_003698 [Ranatra chinensis]|uniref:ABC transporter domain-containing protein n=1 Tax=Ranatra chinensis TaxID=642074 RepID=A0ABD0YMF0_9HEMI
MGPSGAGKTTLLNILAGYICRGSNGRVNVNGQDRRELGMEQFRTVSCYIQQEDIVRSRLTVMEAMMLATHLKLGCTISREEKKLKNLYIFIPVLMFLFIYAIKACSYFQVEELLEMLGLAQNARTLSGKLSGGQKKRLSIALELISNPPILFLDEPTTGLDSCSTTSCISLLRELAVNQGRTVVCTVHQPSALLFEQFSQIYCLTGGRCLYQGQPSTITTFFMGHGLSCPPYHNPADFSKC